MTIARNIPGSGRISAALAMCALASLLIAGCSEDPGESESLVGSLPVDSFDTRDTTIIADSSWSARRYIPMNSPVNLLGRTSEGYQAMSMVQFFSLPHRDTIIVESATLTLTAVTWYGDSSGSLAFTAHRIERGWNPETVTWDSVQAGFYESGVERGSYSGGAAPDTHAIAVPLDTAMVRQWLRRLSTDAVKNYGVALVPREGSTIVRGLGAMTIDSSSYWPKLRVVAVNVAGTVRDTASYSGGIDSFVGNQDNLVQDPSLIYLQAGVAYRSQVHFPMAGIPRGAIINAAQMDLSFNDAGASLGKFVRDRVVSAQLLVGGSEVTSSAESELSGAYGRPKTEAPEVYSFNVRHHAQAWVRGPNYGALVRTVNSSETRSIDRYLFHNERSSDPALRPRLHVTYSIPKQGGTN
jgi:hypothetical protein